MKSDKEALKPLYRLVDANLNRLREGIRVVEDICRYVYEDKEIAYKLKKLRHQSKINEVTFILHRDIKNDPLKQSIQEEKKRQSVADLLTANIKRAQESARVLEESFKLFDPILAEKFKTIRYELYDIELTLQKNHLSD